MSKHHIKSLAEQIANKGYGSAPFHRVKDPYLAKEVIVEDNSIQIRAYHIHHEKGGSALDNWLEAERNLKSDVSRLINEGDPNTQR